MNPKGRTLPFFQDGRQAGTLWRTSDGISLDYDPDWLARKEATPVSLSLPLRSGSHGGAAVRRFLDGLLPESESQRARLAVRLDAPDTHPFTLIEALGRCSAGALAFVPHGEDPGAPGAVAGEPITESEIERLLADLPQRPLGVDRRFRFSLAGAQRKTALLRREGEWLRPTGFTPTTHILKPQVGPLLGADFRRSVENEFLCLEFTRAFGVETTGVEIGDFGRQRALVVERFDRRWTPDGRLVRIPHEDCLQALGGATHLKYESDGGPGMTRLLDLLRGAVDPDADRRAFLRGQIVFWLLAAIDGHAKNYSLRLLRRGEYRLAPLYDIVSVQPALDSGQLGPDEVAMALAVGADRATDLRWITPEHFVQTGAAAGIPTTVTRAVFEELVEVRAAAFDAVRERLPDDFPPEIGEPILRGAAARLDRIASFLTA